MVPPELGPPPSVPAGAEKVCPATDIETLARGNALMPKETIEVEPMTVRERKDLPWIIAAFAIVFLLTCGGLFGGFGVLAGH
jgi:hypothetical protein